MFVLPAPHKCFYPPVFQEPISRLEQFGGEPEEENPEDAQQQSRRTKKKKATQKKTKKGDQKKGGKGKGKGKKGDQKNKGKDGKGKEKGKGRGNKNKKQDSGPGETSETKRKRKVGTAEIAMPEDPCTPKKKETKKKDECSRSKKSKVRPEVAEVAAGKQKTEKKKGQMVKVEAKPQRKKRASNGEAISFARRNPPVKPRPLAEWTAIRAAFREHLMHMTPLNVHEDFNIL